MPSAVEWFDAGIPLEEVSRLLGHSSIRTTEKHYARWVKSRQDRLDALLIATWKELPKAPGVADSQAQEPRQRAPACDSARHGD